MEHHAPHTSSVFEGYYSKFDLPSGAHLAIIICTVKSAKQRPHMLSLTYVPKNDAPRTFQKEIWPDHMEMKTLFTGKSFILNAPGIGYAEWHEDSTTEYNFECEHFSFKGWTTSHVPWSTGTNTPEGVLVNLPLPLHWHVQSLGSECEFSLKIPGFELPSQDMSGTAIVHQEKNWAHSFPSAHMWLQARSADRSRSFCAAGGQILGMEAFLLGYRSKDLNLDFRPPFAVKVLGLSPFMSYTSKWVDRRFELSIQSFRQKIVVRASAPKGSFFSLSAPFLEGHRKNYLGQSFEAVIEVEIYESGWFSPWRRVRKDVFDNASLEFGAGYYPPAGSDERFH